MTGQRPTTLLAELTHRCPLHCPYCSNPLAMQGLDSAWQWPLVILGCFTTLTTIDLVSGAAFAVSKDVKVDMVPASTP